MEHYFTWLRPKLLADVWSITLHDLGLSSWLMYGTLGHWQMSSEELWCSASLHLQMFLTFTLQSRCKIRPVWGCYRSTCVLLWLQSLKMEKEQAVRQGQRSKAVTYMIERQQTGRGGAHRQAIEVRQLEHSTAPAEVRRTDGVSSIHKMFRICTCRNPLHPHWLNKGFIYKRPKDVG